MRSIIAISAWLWTLVALSSWGGLQGCAALQQEHAKTALNLYADAIPGAHKIATDVCLSKQTSIVTEMEAQKITPDQAQGLVAAVRKDCDKVDQAFQNMQALHSAAKLAYAAHETGELERLLNQLTGAWRALGGGS